MKHSALFLLSSYLSISHSAIFGTKQFASHTPHAALSNFVSTFTTAPHEAIQQVENEECEHLLPRIAKDYEVSDWLHFFLKVALQVTQQYNLGMYQVISNTKVCLHQDSTKRISFPESTILFHDQGILTIPQVVNSSMNQRVLHPFDDFVAFARSDLANPLIPYYLDSDRSLLKLLFSEGSPRHLSPFTEEGQERLILPFHPIHMVLELREGLISLNEPIDKVTQAEIERQVRISNRSLSHPVPFPLPDKAAESIFIPKVFPFFDPKDTKFNLNEFPFDDVKKLWEKVSKQKIPDMKIVDELPEPSDDEDDPLPKFSSVLLDPTTIYCKINARENISTMNKLVGLRLGRNINLDYPKIELMSTEEKNELKDALDVSDSHEYFLTHPFYSHYTSTNPESQRTIFSLRNYIKDVCHEYQKFEVPLLDAVCKGSFTSSPDSPLIFDQQLPEELNQLASSWFTSFLSGKPHSLDGYSDGPSILKAQLMNLVERSLEDIIRRNPSKIQPKDSLERQKLMNILDIPLLKDQKPAFRKNYGVIIRPATNNGLSNTIPNVSVDSIGFEGFFACGKIMAAFLEYFSYVTTPSPHTLPFPMMMSQQYAYNEIDQIEKGDKDLILNFNRFQPIKRAYRLIIPKIYNNSLSDDDAFSAKCYLSQYTKENCFIDLLRFIYIDVVNNPIKIEAERLYSSVSLLSKEPLLRSFKSRNYLLFYSVLLSHNNALYHATKISFKTTFAFFLVTLLLNLKQDISPVDLLNNPEEYYALEYPFADLIKGEYNFDIKLEMEKLYESQMQSYLISSTTPFIQDIIKQVRYAIVSLNLNYDDAAIQMIIPWAFKFYKHPRSYSEQDLKSNSPIMGILSTEGQSMFNIILHDAVVYNFLNNIDVHQSEHQVFF